MDRIFLDANIFFAAVASKTGGSHFLFRLAEKKKITLVSNEYALMEAKVNIQKKLGNKHIPSFFKMVSILFELIDEKEVPQKMEYYTTLIVPKDAPILLGAVWGKVQYLITLDRKDFQTDALKKAPLPFQIMTPGQYLHRLL